MINDLDQTITNLLFDVGKLNRGHIDVTFERPVREWSASLTRPTINCWLFDIRENTQLRSREMMIENDMEQRRASRYVAPFRFQLNYLLTAWANRVADEHQLLWRTLTMFSSIPELNPDQCEGDLKNQPYEIPLQVGQMDDPSINIIDLWSVLGNDMRSGFTVGFTLAVDTRLIDSELPLVTEGRVQFGQTPNPSQQKIKAMDSDNIEIPRSEWDQLNELIDRLRPKS